jgi:5,6-dimethylbenzimidazole synthase
MASCSPQKAALVFPGQVSWLTGRKTSAAASLPRRPAAEWGHEAAFLFTVAGPRRFCTGLPFSSLAGALGKLCFYHRSAGALLRALRGNVGAVAFRSGVVNFKALGGQPGAVAFGNEFREQFRDLLLWRRDVRRFLPNPLPEGLLEELLALACLSPSVGLSEPWRFVRVADTARRNAVRTEFERANSEALAGYSGEQAALYARLKLAGLDQAPVHLAVFADPATRKGSGLGRRTMPEMLEYSVVTAISILWLAARAYGVGIGWVSILDAARVSGILEVPSDWELIAYLCIGYPEEESITPELERAGWEKRTGGDFLLFER